MRGIFEHVFQVTGEPVPTNIDSESLGLPPPVQIDDDGEMAPNTEASAASFDNFAFVGQLET